MLSKWSLLSSLWFSFLFLIIRTVCNIGFFFFFTSSVHHSQRRIPWNIKPAATLQVTNIEHKQADITNHQPQNLALVCFQAFKGTYASLERFHIRKVYGTPQSNVGASWQGKPACKLVVLAEACLEVCLKLARQACISLLHACKWAASWRS